MKHKIFISMHYMEIGGAETALIGLLQSFDYSKYDVDLFLYAHRGEMMQFIPKEVNLLPEIPIYAQIERPMKSVLLNGYLKMIFVRLKGKVQTWSYKRQHKSKESGAGLQYTANAVAPLLPEINPGVEYELAISFLQPHNVVRDKVRAKRKICWIHTDYSVVDVNAAMELPVWSSFDKIVSISEDVTKTFVQTFPSLKSKIVLIENILSPEFVRRRAGESDVSSEMPQCTQTINILSIGRYCYQKNLENIPDICKRVNSSLFTLHPSLKVKWYIMGYGGDEQLICDRISEGGMEGQVILLGKKSNPYPYIKACDIYCQPSRYEGKSVTVREAQMLGKPVIVTNYPTASSQIKDGVDGVIVPMDNEGCAQGIIDLVNDVAKREEIIAYLQTHDYGNEKEVEKLYSLIYE